MGPTTRNSRVIESEAEDEVDDNQEEEQNEVGGELEEDPIVDSDDDDNGVPDAEVVKENESMSRSNFSPMTLEQTLRFRHL